MCIHTIIALTGHLAIQQETLLWSLYRATNSGIVMQWVGRHTCD